MLTRRNFLSFVAAVPVLGRLVPPDKDALAADLARIEAAPADSFVPVSSAWVVRECSYNEATGELTVEYGYYPPQFLKSRPHGILSESPPHV